MKSIVATPLIAVMILFVATPADAGLFRCLFGRRCVAKHKTVERDCCGNVTKTKVVVRRACCDPCCKPACEDKPCDKPGEKEVGAACKDGACQVSGLQAECQRRVRIMAMRRLSGHPFGLPRGVRFEGTGWSSGGTPGTCTPSRGMRLVADAVAVGPDGVTRRIRWWN